jgi:hypothetical protein
MAIPEPPPQLVQEVATIEVVNGTGHAPLAELVTVLHLIKAVKASSRANKSVSGFFMITPPGATSFLGKVGGKLEFGRVTLNG